MKPEWVQRQMRGNKTPDPNAAERLKRSQDLWKLYGKEHKLFWDKRRIKKLEKLNKESFD